MKVIKGILLFLFTLSLSSVSLGQTSRIETGDVLGYEVSNAKQVGSQPVTFQPTPHRKVKIAIEENGDRTYLFENGNIFSVTDKLFTRINNRGRPIEDGYRFRMFPPDKKLEPGLQWETSFRYSAGKYGDNQVNYRATAKNGPDIPIAIMIGEDKKDVMVRTILVEYEGQIFSTMNSWSARAENQILYSPDLGEIVSNKYVGYDQGYLMPGGFSWTLQYVIKAKKSESASPPAVK